MPDFRITCKAGSLLTYSKPVAPAGDLFRRSLPPYFHVDFPIKDIIELLGAEIINGKKIESAGICLIPAPTMVQQDTLYAFKVVWDENERGDLIANPNNMNVVNIAVPDDLQPQAEDVVPQPNFVKGSKIWTQNLAIEYQPDMNMAFAFFPYNALKRLVERAIDTRFSHIRFRRLLVKSKKKVKNNEGAGDIFTNGQKENYQNLIAELAPTWAEKYYSSLTVTGLETNDADATANEYGHPCPPVWKENFTPNSNIKGYGIISSTETIHIANGAAIRISDLFGALMQNNEAKKLLKGWESFNQTKVLVVKKGGKEFEVANP